MGYEHIVSRYKDVNFNLLAYIYFEIPSPVKLQNDITLHKLWQLQNNFHIYGNVQELINSSGHMELFFP